MLSLHTNNAALSAQNAISRNQNNLSTSMTRLSTGYRINSAMDDAAGLQIATRLKAQSSGMAIAMRNTQNATSMMQTAEGALGEASNILVRMKDLATQAADASSNASDKTAMQSEYDALASELTNIIGNTSFGGAKLLSSKPHKPPRKTHWHWQRLKKARPRRLTPTLSPIRRPAALAPSQRRRKPNGPTTM